MRSFASIESVGPLTERRLLLLLALGILTVVSEEAARWSLKLPGHHGIEGMAFLVIGRLVCTHRWSATIVALGSAVAATSLGAGHGMLTPVFYVVPGVTLDLAVLLVPGWRMHLLVLPAFAALAHATKPIIRWIGAQTAGLEFGSLTSGVLYPISTHLAFGFSGALIAVLLWRGWHGWRRLSEI